MQGVPIDGAFDDYHGGLVGIGGDPEQSPLQAWTTNRDLRGPEIANAFLP